MPAAVDDAGIRRYLLGLLPEAEAEALEQGYFASPEVWERVRGVEDDLLDDYVANRLGDREKDALESRYLKSPALRERVATARALHRAAAGSRTTGSATGRVVRWAAPVAVAAGLLVAMLAFWTPTSRAPDRAAASPTSAPQPTAPPRSPEADRSTEPPPSPPYARVARTVVFALSPVLLRSEGPSVEHRVPAGTETLVLELEGDPALLPARASRLEARIETVEGRSVWTGEARRATARRRPDLLVTARVPATRLAPGDYVLTLSGPAGGDWMIHRYYLRIAP